MTRPTSVSARKHNKSRRLHQAKAYGQGTWATCEIYLPGHRKRVLKDGSPTKAVLDKKEFLRALKEAVDDAVLMKGGETRWYSE